MALLPIIWIGLIGFCIIMYVILDGFTLGAGLLLPFDSDQHHRDLIFSSILPTWDGNQTWLVLGGAMLYGAFPKAFSLLLPNLYLPLIMMVTALLFRGVSLEFRLKAARHTIKRWDMLFFVGCFIATLMQGMVLGTFIQGFSGSLHHLHVDPYFWFSPFSIFTACSLLVGYALLGATRLIMKTTDSLQAFMYVFAKVMLGILAFLMIIVSLWTPFMNDFIKVRWFIGNYHRYLGIFPLCSIFTFVACWRALTRQNEHQPYWWSVVIFLLAYIGLGISVWPYIVPYRLSIWQAAAPSSSLIFILVGACIMLPVLLFYTGYSYYVFRGKTKEVLKY